MKLFVNGRFLTQRTSGVQSFAREICRELQKEIDIVILVPKKTKLYNADEFSNNIKQIGFLRGHIWEQTSLPFFIGRQLNAKLLNLCNTGPLLVKKQICTIHDLAFIKNKKWFNPLFSIFYNFLIPRLLKKCSNVLTVSKTIKNELINEYNVNEKKIEVLGNKVPHDMQNIKHITCFDERLCSKQFFLMVGSNNPRKNLMFVEQLFNKEIKDKKLVIAGGSHPSFNSHKNIAINGDNIIRLDYIDNEKLVWLYTNAIGLINPSLYEGFGIPNIEAMMFNCPVICSDIPVFKEICQQAAFYFSPDDSNSLKNCLLHDINNKSILEEKIITGKKIAEGFQNFNSARIILNMLK